MKRLKMDLILVFVLSLIFSSNVLAQPKETEVDGLILSQTQTTFGYEFYQSFVTFWKELEVTKDYTILILERANPIWGIWIEIEVKETTVYQHRLQPRSEEIESEAKEAVKSTRQYLLDNYNILRREIKENDAIDDGMIEEEEEDGSIAEDGVLDELLIEEGI